MPSLRNASLTWLRAPAGISAVHGLSGTYYMVRDAGLVAVMPQDAAGLLAHGFVSVADDAADAADTAGEAAASQVAGPRWPMGTDKR